MKCEINVYKDDSRVALRMPDGIIYVHPKVAVELAMSLIWVAIDTDPDMDAEAVVDDYTKAMGRVIQ